MNVKHLIQGMRPKTLGAAFVPPVLSLFIAKQYTDVDYKWPILCLLLAIFIQIATNFYNDAIDCLKGADDKRVGPKRLGANENINVKSIFLVGHISLLLAFACGVPLVLKGGIPFLILGLISLFFAYGYTGGPFPLAYLGLGELFVFIFFGLVATLGSYYLYVEHISIEAVLVANQIGFLSCTLIGINNFRDRKTDKEVQKNTLATKLSESQFLFLMDIFLFLPFVLVLIHSLWLKLSFIIGLLAVGHAHRIRHILRVTPSQCNDALALAGKQLLFFCVLYCLGSLWG